MSSRRCSGSGVEPELIAVVVVAGVATGVLSALFGVGGGILMVPFIVLVLGESQHLAEGTSLLVIVPTALVGALAHWRNRFVSLRDAALLAVGGMAGVYLGASIALEISPVRLQVVFGIFVAVMGVRNMVLGARAART